MSRVTEYTSPVPMPALDATPPEVYRGIYGMPMFLTITTADLAATRDFWIRGLGFVDLFSIPDRLTHLRRWAFQDVLIVPGPQPDEPPTTSISFACVLSQLDEVVAACEEILPGCTTGPAVMPWNSMELTVITPERTRVVMTAARPLDPNSEQAANLREIGIEVPDALS